ncbi:Lar family restriction alleviation protein [Pseudorhizobium flavum]|uniref:Lar family restriction alleviation protein n=1 Tax=Pseudorhizobium flavum TaxID=1335061 RepID=UPI003CD0D8F4
MQDDNRQPTPGVHENFASDIAKPAHGSRNGLLPCPFCGGVGDFSDVNAWWVRCDQCNAETEAFMSPEEATEAWNRRTPHPNHMWKGPKSASASEAAAYTQAPMFSLAQIASIAISAVTRCQRTG